MESIVDFLSAKTEAFQNGDFEKAADGAAVPMPLYFRDGLVILRNSQEVADLLARLDDSLAKTGSVRTVFEVLHISDADEKGLRLVIRFTNLTARYRAIGSLDVRYFCLRTVEGNWQFSLVEVLSPASARLEAVLEAK